MLNAGKMGAMKTPLTAKYRTVLLPDQPSVADLLTLVEPYDAMITAQFRAIVDRTERSPLRPWLDSRIDLTSGRDLPTAAEATASGWVQGRGLEGLAKFGAWLAPHAADPDVAALLDRTRQVTAGLLDQTGQVRERFGHLYFAMLPDGTPVIRRGDGRLESLAFDASTPFTYSDLFASKGMYAAAHFLGDTAAQAVARRYCLDLYDALLAGHFQSDQPQPAQLASVVTATGGVPHGPYMISLGMASEFARHEPGAASTEMGLKLTRRVLYGHVNLDRRWPNLHSNDLVEFITPDGTPFADESGRLISDPGHSLEFVGLFLKFSRAVAESGGATPEQQGELAHIDALMPRILTEAFENGFRTAAGGIIKTIDLATRRPIDDTMPWWSLPETIRAAFAAAHVATEPETSQRCLAIAAQSHNAFVQHYVRPEIHLMAIKLRDAEGRVSDIVPAYPDADPGYHTALSLMDALQLIRAQP
jgi:hypothetical protein